MQGRRPGAGNGIVRFGGGEIGYPLFFFSTRFRAFSIASSRADFAGFSAGAGGASGAAAGGVAAGRSDGLSRGTTLFRSGIAFSFARFRNRSTRSFSGRAITSAAARR